MNPNNYASLEASKRLVEAGIVLETEAGWYKIYRPGCHSFDMVLSLRSGNEKFYGDNFPAPSMAEVWRELPEEYYKDATDPIRYKVLMSNQVGYHSGGKDAGIWFHIESNPADAIISLLIRVRKEAK
jgi:hypothetical protein